MDKDNYIAERLEKQIKWYDDKSQYNQKWFKSLQVTEIVCAAIIPFLAGMCIYNSVPYGQIIIGALGVIITICAGLSTLNKYQENWFTYRITCQTLIHEKYLFLTQSEPYKDDSAFTIFVERIESLISKENSQWSRFANDKPHNKRIN